MNTFTYKIDNNLYINLTNKCTNACVFCVRDNKATYSGYPLWLDNEPSCDDVKASAGDVSSYDEIVFCGYGEPTFKLDNIIELATYFKSLGKKTRLNTNGHGNSINKKNIAPILAPLIDTISISLNQSDSEKYEAICKCCYGERGFDIMLDFARDCVAENIHTVLSVVDVEGVDVPACQKVADSVGAVLKVRPYIDEDAQ